MIACLPTYEGVQTAVAIPEDQVFTLQERLFRRVPASHMLGGRATLAGIKAGLSYPDKAEGEARNLKSPSCVRQKHGTPEDARSPHCANGRDVSNFAVISIEVGQLPINFETVIGRHFDFYAFHQPLNTCPGHTLIHSCETGASSPQYDDPTQDAKNKLRVEFYQKQVVELNAPTN